MKDKYKAMLYTGAKVICSAVVIGMATLGTLYVCRSFQENRDIPGVANEIGKDARHVYDSAGDHLAEMCKGMYEAVKDPAGQLKESNEHFKKEIVGE